MNEFEFLRNLPFGQYISLDSPLERIDCRARILSFVLVLGVLTLTQNMAGLIFGLSFLVLGAWLARLPLKYALRGLLPPLPFLVLLALLQVFFNQNPDQGIHIVQLGKNVIAMSDLVLGLKLLLRFTALILGLTMASNSISTSEMTHGLESLLTPLKWLRIPVHDFVVVIQVSLRYIPLLAQVAERIAKAQASRGVEWQKSGKSLLTRVRLIIPLMLPLFLTSLRRAELMALAMDARAYGINPGRSSLIEYRFGWQDAAFLLLALLGSATILFLPL